MRSVTLTINISGPQEALLKSFKIDAGTILLSDKEKIKYKKSLDVLETKGLITIYVSSWGYQETEYFITGIGKEFLK